MRGTRWGAYAEFVGFRAQTDVERRVEFVADGDQELPVLRSEPFIVPAEDHQLGDAVLGRALAVNLDQRSAVLRCARCGVCGAIRRRP